MRLLPVKVGLELPFLLRWMGLTGNGPPSYPLAPWVEGSGSILWLYAEYPGHFQVS